MEIPASWNFAGWIGCLGFFLWVLLMIFKLGDRVRGRSPQPANEQLEHSQQLLRERVEKLEAAQAAILSEMKQDRADIIQAGEVRAHQIHERLNPAAENIAEVKGQMAAFTQSFDNFTKIITDLALGRKL